MDENEPNDRELSEQEADEILREAIGDSADEPPISEAKANRFYDRLRTKITSYLERGKAPSAARDALLFAPDTFILLTRLARDPRVTGKNKVLLGSAIAYFIFPLDLMPEAIFGPIGYLDDLIFAVYVLNRMLGDTDEEILREHWSGRGDVLQMIRQILASADKLVASDVVKNIKKLF
jgi:uncharacterized membrane protein YkvA (DUF1232 family)